MRFKSRAPVTARCSGGRRVTMETTAGPVAMETVVPWLPGGPRRREARRHALLVVIGEVGTEPERGALRGALERGEERCPRAARCRCPPSVAALPRGFALRPEGRRRAWGNGMRAASGRAPLGGAAPRGAERCGSGRAELARARHSGALRTFGPQTFAFFSLPFCTSSPDSHLSRGSAGRVSSPSCPNFG